jgi:IS605 OrfB family transposase
MTAFTRGYLLVTRTLRLKVRAESYAWLSAAAIEVNRVWNWANETSAKAARPFAGKGKWLSGFDLDKLSTGASNEFEHIGSDTVQRINREHAAKRLQFKKSKLRWRVSRGARKSLGWIPFKAPNLKRKGNVLRFAGKSFRVFESDKLEDMEWKQGSFAQDAVGDWWLCLTIEYQVEQSVAPRESVGIDLGLTTIATTSDGDTLEAGRWTRDIADKLAMAQRRGHKKQAKRLQRKCARRRKDALHKFSRKIVDQYQHIVVGDVSSTKLVKTKMAKSVLDSGWGMLKNFLDYKSQQAARSFSVVNEKYTSVTCSSCGSRSGPSGVNGLIVRSWICSECGDSHDRDVNAARNILTAARRSPSVSGNELSLQVAA